MLGSVGNSFASSSFISASGLMDASLRLHAGSHNIANANTNGFIPDRVTSVAEPAGGVRSQVTIGNAGLPPDTTNPSQTDYALEGVNLLLARHAFQANARALRAQIQSETSLMDVFG